MKEAYREISPSRYLPTEEHIVLDALADMLEQTITLSEWVQRYKPLPRHLLLKHLYASAGTPPEERVPPAPTDPTWSPNNVQCILMYGPMRSGKTNSAVGFALEAMADAPGLVILAVRRTYDEIGDTIFGDTKVFCGRYGIPNETREDPPDLWLPSGSRLVLRSTQRDEKPGQDKASSLQGMEFGAAILEEADRIPEHYFETVLGRLSQSGLERPFVLILCNPPGKNHWIYKRFFQPNPQTGRIPDNYHAIHYPLEDNRANIRPGYIEDLKRELENSPSRYARFFEGKFTPPVVGSALFRKYFRREQHVKSTLASIPGVPLWVGMDFGFVHPAIVVAQEDPVTLQVRVLWEYMGNEVMLEDFVKDAQRRIARQFPGYETEWYVDPHGRARNAHSTKTDISILRDCGIHPTYKDAEVKIGLSCMATLMYTYCFDMNPAQPLLVIAEDCVDLVDGFSHGYTQNPKRHVDGADDELQPYKDGFYEHLMDALRYIVINKRHSGKTRRPGQKAIPGEFQTIEGWRQTERQWDLYGRGDLRQYSTDQEVEPEANQKPYYGFGEAYGG